MSEVGVQAGSGSNGGRGGSGGMALLLGAVLVLLGAVLVLVVVLLRRDDEPTAGPAADLIEVPGSTTTGSAQVPAASTAAPPAAAPSTTAIINLDPMLLEPGLLCRDLQDRGYSYSAAVTYWQREGLPDRMDKDRNGVPCETVYTVSDVVARFPELAATRRSADDLSSGYLCRDLKAMGYDVYTAIDYFYYEGEPSRMDEDLNGIPCETVYPEVADIYG